MATVRKFSDTTRDDSESCVFISISKVRVIVRVRPFLPHEIAAAKNGNPILCTSILDQDCESGEEVVVHLNDQETSRRECYKLDSFLGPHDNNVSTIFLQRGKPFDSRYLSWLQCHCLRLWGNWQWENLHHARH